MSWTDDLLAAFSAQLHAAGVATWRPPPGVYQSGETPIVHGALPPSPDEAIALQTYGVDQNADDVNNTDGTLGLQVRMRGTPDDISTVNALADDVFDAFQGLELPGVGVLLCTRSISAPLGQDGNARFERADSYRLLTHHATTHRPG